MQNDKRLMEPTPQKDFDQDTVMDDMSVVEVSAMEEVSHLGPNEDVMADFGGFLEKRKKDKNM